MQSLITIPTKSVTNQEGRDLLQQQERWRLSQEQIVDDRDQELFCQSAAVWSALDLTDSLRNQQTQFVIQ